MSRVSSFDLAGSLAVMPIGFALAGPLAGAIGASAAIIACSAAAIAMTLTTLLVRDIRTLQAEPIVSTA